MIVSEMLILIYFVYTM